jgi:predicted Zn-dependent protease
MSRLLAGLRQARPALLAAAVVLLLAACTPVPYTGRSQLILVSEQEELGLGARAYQQVLQKEKVSTDTEAAVLVERVGRRVAAVADRPDYTWQFKLVESESANAFCLPGGKVAVYTGILPYTQNEAGLAAVIAHEVAHALARHGAERLSRARLVELGELGVAAATGVGSQTMQLVNLAYGLGVEMPFSRSQELEADRIGLILMAKAGYDPREALSFWRRMAAKGEGKRLPQFLSTHPYDEVRVEQLEVWLPEALDYYRQASRPKP